MEGPASSGHARAALFGVGQIATQIFRDAPSLLLLFFMTNTLGVPPGLAGVAIFAPKFVWGVLCDLLVGFASDRMGARFPRRYWLLFGAVLAPAAMILLFFVPPGQPNDQALHIAVVFSFYMLAFSLFSVPHLAISTGMSSDTHGRTKVMAWRLVFTAVGVLIASSLGPFLLQRLGGGEEAYRTLALFLASVSAVALLIAFFAAPRIAASPQAEPGGGMLASVLLAPRFVGLLGPVLLQLIGSGLSYATMVYFLTYNLGRSDAFAQLGIMVLIMTAGIVLAQPLWLMTSRLVGKANAYLLATVGYGAAFAIWAGLGPESPITWSYVIAFAVGVLNSGWALMSFSILSDVIAEDAAERGRDRSGAFSSIWVAADKIGFAVGGTLLVGLILSVSGFNSLQAVTGAPQVPSALSGIAVAYGYAPAVLNLLAIAWFVLARGGRTGAGQTAATPAS